MNILKVTRKSQNLIELASRLFTSIKSTSIKQHSCFLFAPLQALTVFSWLCWLVGESPVRELNTSCNLNLLWATYYRLLLLSSLFCLSSFTSPPLSCSLSLIFLFQWWDREEEGRLSPACQLSPLSVSLSGLIGVGETQALSQRAQPEQWRSI